VTVRFSKGLEPFLVPIDSVKPDPRNPNHGDDENLIESILINGFVTLCTADANTGLMVAGHTRQRALKKLGATHIPVLWEDNWDETGAKRYMVGDNASSRKAVMDDAALLELVKELHETDIGLTGSSITEAEYEAMLLEDAVEEAPEGVGFGGNPAPAGLHQVIVEFQDDPDSRDEAFAELSQRYESVRTADL
jgi:ParB-like chromosome segregation protein Spo0J